MRKEHMTVELMAYTPDPEKICGEAAAICTHSGNPEKALRAAMRSGHESVLEHASYTFRITGLSRVALAQLTRHRLASFSVQSQRYVPLEPESQHYPDSIQKHGFSRKAARLMKAAMDLYAEMTEAGVPREDARYLIPQGVETELILTMNVRELRHFFRLRCCERAQEEMQRLADTMLELCRGTAPLLFRDAGAPCMLGTCPEAHPCGSYHVNPSSLRDKTENAMKDETNSKAKEGT